MSRATIDKMNASKHEIEHAQQEGIEILGGVTPIACVLDEKGRAIALRVADFTMEGKETKITAGTERDLPADLIDEGLVAVATDRACGLIGVG